MLTFPTKQIFVEGPDCSGKTTLVRKIHSLSGFRWHIHDRSQISRSVFAKMYGRNLENIEEDLHIELSNLNNRFIFLTPSKEVIRKRFIERGDDIHDSSSIMRVWSSFIKEAESFENYPNVIVKSGEDTGKIAENVSAYLHLLESSSIREISEYVYNFVKACRGFESYPLEFTIYDSGEFEEASEDSMNHESEREYYEKIYKSLHDKITKELDGDNEYSRVETHNSRRFVYTDNSCISFIQLAIRNDVMDVHTVLRSSDVENTFYHDLKFMYFLASTCYNRFSNSCNKVRMRFNLNSAHFVR